MDGVKGEKVILEQRKEQRPARLFQAHGKQLLRVAGAELAQKLVEHFRFVREGEKFFGVGGGVE